MRITAFFLGGTIAMTSERGHGASPRLTSAELLAGLEGSQAIQVTGVDFRKVGSSHLALADVLALSRAADEAVTSGEEAVLVVQGTDTMEETAYLLDLLWRHDAPLVVTGAMRTPGHPGADGPGNLAAALAVATSRECRGLGAVVVLNDQVHAARRVAKRHTSATDAFVSPGWGPLGRMLEGRPVLAGRPVRRTPLQMPGALHKRVALVTATLDDSPEVYDGVAAGVDGLVVAGFGAGHVRPDVADVLAGHTTRIPVVLASRCGAGSVHTRTYGGPGSEEDLLGRGLLSAGHLDGLKARVLLAVLLAGGADAEAMASAFAEHGAA